MKAILAFLKMLRNAIRRCTRWPPVGTLDHGDLWRVTPISPNWGVDRGLPIDRYHIQLFVSRWKEDIRGHVLEFANDRYTRRYGGEGVAKIDVLHDKSGNPSATIVADLQCAPQLPSEIFDCIICTQVLEYVYDLPAAVRTLYRLLKPGGVLLVSVPGICKIAHEDVGIRSEYWRFTSASVKRLFEETCPTAQRELQAYGNVLTAITFLHGVAAEELTHDELNYHDPYYESLITVRVTKPALAR